jgi:rhodanese-related sulfurtransferase
MQTARVETIQAGELAKLWKENPALAVIDVRTAGEYESVHAAGAKLQPLQELDASRFLSSHGSKDKPVYLLCKSGVRATQAAEKLLEAGLAKPVVVEGGTDSWVAAGLPVERRGRNVLPLDRQMRTVAGTMIFLGASLALTVHPAFVWIPLFMGGGLVFSGLTGLCPMSNLIAKMPWNRASGGDCCTG